MHKLLSLDEVTNAAICSVCGPVQAHLKGRDPNGVRRRECGNRSKLRERARGKDRHMFKLYGIQLSDYLRIKEAQDGKCALCLWEKNLHVDHSHITGIVRGLLCARCNNHIRDVENLGYAHALPTVAEYLTRNCMTMPPS